MSEAHIRSDLQRANNEAAWQKIKAGCDSYFLTGPKGYLEKNGGQNPWGLLADARLRLWPAGSPWVARDTFAYPARQRWFASYTQMANEPVYVDGGDLPAKREIYYHFGLDIGGSEGLVDVVSATEGMVTSSGNEVLAGQAPDAPAEPRYDNVTDEAGRVDYDFMVVQVIDRAHPNKPPPTIHANYAPTFRIRPGDPVVFKVRTFRDDAGGETWDFGDGSPAITVRSDANALRHAPNGYAETLHAYDQPGRYLVSVEHVSADGVRAVARLQVRVGME